MCADKVYRAEDDSQLLSDYQRSSGDARLTKRQQEKRGENTLYRASFDCDMEKAEEFLTAGADINEIGKKALQSTPLAIAAERAHTDMASCTGLSLCA